MSCKSEITIKIREDILKLATAKAEKYGYTLDFLINDFLISTIRAKKFPFETEYFLELPPIINSDELADRFEEILEQLQTTEEAFCIAHDSELSGVIMSQEKYEALKTTIKYLEENNI